MQQPPQLQPQGTSTTILLRQRHQHEPQSVQGAQRRAAAIPKLRHRAVEATSYPVLPALQQRVNASRQNEVKETHHAAANPQQPSLPASSHFRHSFQYNGVKRRAAATPKPTTQQQALQPEANTTATLLGLLHSAIDSAADGRSHSLSSFYHHSPTPKGQSDPLPVQGHNATPWPLPKLRHNAAGATSYPVLPCAAILHQ